MKKQVLLALSLSLCLLLAACGEAGNSSGSGSSADNGHSADGSSPSDSSFDPWDNMGGGGTAESVGASKVSVADYAPDSYIVVSDEQKAVGAENATAVDLSSLSDATAPAGTSFQKNKLTVSSAGDGKVKRLYKRRRRGRHGASDFKRRGNFHDGGTDERGDRV